MQGLRRIHMASIAERLGNYVLTSMAPLFHLTGGEKQQFDRQAVIGQLLAQDIRFLKPRMARQPFIRHRHQQIQVGIGPFGAAGAGAE